MTRYDTDRHHRRSIRLREYDYTQKGAYFITICTRERNLYFELYPELRHIVQNQWESLPRRVPEMKLDAFVIMPNHIHAIIFLITSVGETLAAAQKTAKVGETLAVSPRALDRAGASPAPTLGNVVGAFKSLCVDEWLKYIRRDNMDAVGSIWQRNYYDISSAMKRSLTSLENILRTIL